MVTLITKNSRYPIELVVVDNKHGRPAIRNSHNQRLYGILGYASLEEVEVMYANQDATFFIGGKNIHWRDLPSLLSQTPEIGKRAFARKIDERGQYAEDHDSNHDTLIITSPIRGVE